MSDIQLTIATPRAGGSFTTKRDSQAEVTAVGPAASNYTTWEWTVESKEDPSYSVDFTLIEHNEYVNQIDRTYAVYFSDVGVYVLKLKISNPYNLSSTSDIVTVTVSYV